MDFISMLAQQTGVSGDQAQGLAGSVLGMVQGAVGEEQSAAMDSAIPELSGWKAAAANLMGGEEEAPAAEEGGGGMLGGMLSGGAGGMLGSIAGAVGGESARNTVAIAGIAQKFGLDTSKAAMIAPLANNFLSERLGTETMSSILNAVPFLGGGGGDEGGGAGGMLGAAAGMLGGLTGGGDE